MLEKLQWSAHSSRTAIAIGEVVDARGSTVQLANGFLYLDAATAPARSLNGWDAAPGAEASAADVVRRLDAMDEAYRCIALATHCDAALVKARAALAIPLVAVDAMEGDPTAIGPFAAIENLSLGRAGGWFASRVWGRRPEVVLVGESLAGGLPFAAALALRRGDLSGAPPADDDALAPSALAAAAAMYDLLVGEERLDHARCVAAHLTERLQALEADAGGEIAALESMPFGARIGFRTRSAAAIKRKMCERGVLVGLEGDRLSIAPPLVFRPAEVDVVTGAMRGALWNVPTWRPAACCAACEGIRADG
jgi:hypothetical protein